MKTGTKLIFTLGGLFLISCGQGEPPSLERTPGATHGSVATDLKINEPKEVSISAPGIDAGADSEVVTAPDGMIGVPGGRFKMGLDHPKAIPDEQHEHMVEIQPFFLDRTEVTNRAYDECARAGVCRKPAWKDTVKAGFEKYETFRTPLRPVSSVSQGDATAYCKWKGKRLPTEAEFERAARGSDFRMYTWGDEEPSGELSVYRQAVTAPVGSKPRGAGPYGHLDLSGNVWEWTSDNYDPKAYTGDTACSGTPAPCAEILSTQDSLRKTGKKGFTGSNPIPTKCEHVLRGGAFNYFPWGLRASNRVHHLGSWRMIMAGFRCAGDWPGGPRDQANQK